MKDTIIIVMLLFMTSLAVDEKSEAWRGSRSRSSSSSGSSIWSSSGSSSRSSSLSSSESISWNSSSRESGGSSEGWVRRKVNYATDFAKGTGAMIKAYSDMREANWKNSDKYFHARGNADAAKYGDGGKAAATFISDTREVIDRLKGQSKADSAADQEANLHGRTGGDPNKYRPDGLPDKYKK